MDTAFATAPRRGVKPPFRFPAPTSFFLSPGGVLRSTHVADVAGLPVGWLLRICPEPEGREWKAAGGSMVKYHWCAPKNAEPGKIYPLVLFLHGSGARGTGNTAQLRHGAMSILEGGRDPENAVIILPEWALCDSSPARF